MTCIRINKTKLKHYLFSVNMVYQPLHVSGVFTAHHQKVKGKAIPLQAWTDRLPDFKIFGA
jgi:hypothetical protein